jgi:hypothetical protein
VEMSMAAALWLCAARASSKTRPVSWRSSAGPEGHRQGRCGGDAATHARGFLFFHISIFIIMWGIEEEGK